MTASSRPSPSEFGELFALDPGMVFLNHGSFGACPLAIIARQRELQMRVEREPIRYFVEDLEGLLDGVRHALGRFMNADPEGFARMTNATEGVNTVLKSLRFEAGDELLTSNHEYNACNNAMLETAARWGARVVSVDVPWPLHNKRQVIDAVLGGVTGRTRLVLLSHVTSPTGVIFPVGEIVQELNGRGIDTLVDGAHAPGMIALDLTAINAPYYAGNCHKWMCAPKGAGFLWVRADRRHLIRPLITSHGANSARTDRSGFRLEFDYTGTADVSAFLVLPALIEHMNAMLPGGWTGLMAQNRAMALRGRDVLCRELRSDAPAPDEMIGALVSVPIADRRAEEEALPTKYHDALQDRLIARWGVQVPIVVFPARSRKRLVRISMQVYNTIEQVEYLASALRAELGSG